AARRVPLPGPLLPHLELGPAVPRPRGLVLARVERLLLPVADHLEPARVDPVGGEIVPGGVGPAHPQREVVLGGPPLVGVPRDHQRDGRVRAQDGELRVQHLPRVLADREGVVVEEHRAGEDRLRARRRLPAGALLGLSAGALLRLTPGGVVVGGRRGGHRRRGGRLGLLGAGAEGEHRGQHRQENGGSLHHWSLSGRRDRPAGGAGVAHATDHGSARCGGRYDGTTSTGTRTRVSSIMVVDPGATGWTPPAPWLPTTTIPGRISSA